MLGNEIDILAVTLGFNVEPNRTAFVIKLRVRFVTSTFLSRDRIFSKDTTLGERRSCLRVAMLKNGSSIRHDVRHIFTIKSGILRRIGIQMFAARSKTVNELLCGMTKTS